MSNSDVETFEGKIFCNKDDSTCIIQDQNDVFSNLISKKVSAKQNIHQIGKKLDCDYTVGSSPNVHTFRVVSASELSLTNNKNRHAPPEIQKPILMCFSCKLSFGNLKSFTSHAKSDHMLHLEELEKSLLNNEHSSAIVQSSMDEKPQISFLEPLEGQLSDHYTGSCEKSKETEPTKNLRMSDLKTKIDKPNEKLEKTNTIETNTTTTIDQNISPKSEDASVFVDAVAAATAVPDVFKNTVEDSSSTQLGTMNLYLQQTDCAKTRFNDESTAVQSSSISEDHKIEERLLKNSSDFNKLKDEISEQTRQDSNINTFGSHSLFVNNTTSSYNFESSIYKREKIKGDNVKMLNDFIQAQVKSVVETASCEEADDFEIAEASNNSKILKSPSNFSKHQNVPISPTTTTLGNINQNNNSSNSFTIGACSDHINGRPIGLDCSRCEIILNSARLSNNQLSTRNSCKTLKCPQCNWHYKYQETLEIHMREKHPDGESACAYCLAGQQHPRLARGESYSCGYKPYRCEICNYSTTTKGNLSIHMQSDKHLNNMQELNSTQSIVAAAIAAGGSIESVTNKTMLNNKNISENPNKSHDTGPISSPTSNSPNNNSNTNSLGMNIVSSKNKPNFRCDICSYETNVARNLRIHMTSEKHAHNVAVLQNSIKQFHTINMVQQQHQHLYNAPLTSAADHSQGTASDFASNGLIPEVAIADLAYSQALMIQMLQQSAAAAVAAAANPLNIQNAATLGSEEQFPNKSPSLSPSAQLHSNNMVQHSQNLSESNILPFLNNASSQCNNPPDLSEFLPIKPERWPKKIFTCTVCSNFSSDSIDELNHHIQIDRSRMHSGGLNSDFTLIQNNNYICRLCNYKTNLKANFQLHSKTDKHLQKLSYINHIREGGETNEYKLNFLQNNQSTFSMVHLKCNCCDFYTNSIQKLSLHVQHIRHESNSLIFQHFLHNIQILQNNLLHIKQSKCNDSMTAARCNLIQEENNVALHCVLCSFKANNLLEMMQHIKAISHLQIEQLVCMQRKYEKLNSLHLDDMFTVSHSLAEENVKLEPLIQDCNFGEYVESQEANLDTMTSSVPDKKCLIETDPSKDELLRANDYSKDESINDPMMVYKCKHCDTFAQSNDEIVMHLNNLHPNYGKDEYLSIPANLAAIKAFQVAFVAARLAAEKRSFPSEAETEADSVKIKREKLDVSDEEQEEENDNQGYKLSSTDEFGNKEHETYNPVSKTLELSCPLCRESFSVRKVLEMHLIESHTVKKENVSRLLQMVDNIEDHPKTGSTPERNELPPDMNDYLSQKNFSLNCQICNAFFKYEEQILKHAQDLEHYPMKDSEYVCLTANTSLNRCTLTFSSVNCMITHFKDCHMKTIISERHVYKYRCKQCSLAFKTQEKLSVHSLYHTIRESTKCNECNRNFRSVQSLQKHIDLVHGMKMSNNTMIHSGESSGDSFNANAVEQLDATTQSKRNKFELLEKNRVNLEKDEQKEQKSSEKSMEEILENSINRGGEETLQTNILQKSLHEPLQHFPNILPYSLQNFQNLQYMQSQIPQLNNANIPINTVDMLNFMQLQQIMSMNIMNLAPPLVLRPISSPLQESCGTSSLPIDSSVETSLKVQLAPSDVPNIIQQHSPTQLTNNQKRARTRITDEQLKILRAHFDINNSPSEESILEMSQKANLPMKVVKHWFRNTLFKERQRNKDSPYNFNNPPSTTLNLEEYEKTGQTHAPINRQFTDVSNSNSQHSQASKSPLSQSMQSIESKNHNETDEKVMVSPQKKVVVDNNIESGVDILEKLDCKDPLEKCMEKKSESQKMIDHNMDIDDSTATAISPNYLTTSQRQLLSQNSLNACDGRSESGSSDLQSRPQSPNSISALQNFSNVNDLMGQQLDSLMSNISNMGPPKKFQQYCRTSDKNLTSSQFDTNSNSSNSSSTSGGKRANRTRFTDYQIKVLQEFFENNSYPKDSDLEYLSKLLLLSPRVIVVWFQNARQKQRKIYENQPNNVIYESEEKKQNINYTCKKCNLVFQRYYELIRHQKNHCFKEENSKKSAKAQIAAAQIAQNLSSEDSNSSMDIHSNSFSKISSPNIGYQTIVSNSPHSTLNKLSQSEFSPSTTPTPPRCSSIEAQNEVSKQKYDCEKCKISFNSFEHFREHQIVHIIHPNLFLCSNNRNEGGGSGGGGGGGVGGGGGGIVGMNPFDNIIQSIQESVAAQRQIDNSQSSSVPSSSLLTENRKCSETSSNEDLSSMDALSIQGDEQFHKKYELLFQYFLQNEDNPLIKQNFLSQKRVGPDTDSELEFLQSFYRQSESKKFSNYDFLYQYFLKNSHFDSKKIDIEKPDIEFLIRYYQANESKKFFQLEASPERNHDIGASNSEKIDSHSHHHHPASLNEFNQNFKKLNQNLKNDELFNDNDDNENEDDDDESLPYDMARRENCLKNKNINDSGCNISKYSEDEEESSAAVSQSSNQNSQEFLLDHLDNENNFEKSQYVIDRNKADIKSPKGANNEKQNKRLRTTILPDQLNILYECYQNESNPSRKMLEEIAKKVNLKKRVVQVWFQNCRAKDKKSRNHRHFSGQFDENSCTSSPTSDSRNSFNTKLNSHLNNFDSSIKATTMGSVVTTTISDCEICQVQQVDINKHAFSLDHIRNLKLFLKKSSLASQIVNKKEIDNENNDCIRQSEDKIAEGHFKLQIMNNDLFGDHNYNPDTHNDVSEDNLLSKQIDSRISSNIDKTNQTASNKTTATTTNTTATIEKSISSSYIGNIVENFPRFNQIRGTGST